MKYSLLSAFERLPYFTIEGFRQIAGDQIHSEAHARVTLHRWVKAGHLVALKKGVYMHRRFYELHRQEISFAPVVGAILLPQSYVSLEYVLQQHGILTEITYPVTAITLKNTRKINNVLGTFVFRHLHPNLYLGFRITKAYEVPYAIASPAKALFDYLYLRPLKMEIEAQHYSLAEDLRLNLEEFSQEDKNEFVSYVVKNQKIRMRTLKMRRILQNLEQTVWRL